LSSGIRSPCRILLASHSSSGKTQSKGKSHKRVKGIVSHPYKERKSGAFPLSRKLAPQKDKHQEKPGRLFRLPGSFFLG
jgi:hypothetical protein